MITYSGQLPTYRIYIQGNKSVDILKPDVLLISISELQGFCHPALSCKSFKNHLPQTHFDGKLIGILVGEVNIGVTITKEH